MNKLLNSIELEQCHIKFPKKSIANMKISTFIHKQKKKPKERELIKALISDDKKY